MIDGQLAFGDLEEVLLDAREVCLQAMEGVQLTADTLRESADCLVLYVTTTHWDN